MVISRWAATFGSKRSNLSSPNQGLLAALLLTCAKTPEHGAKPIAWSGVASVGHLRVLRLVYSLVQKWLEISVHLEKSHNSYRSLLVFPKRQTQNSRCRRSHNNARDLRSSKSYDVRHNVPGNEAGIPRDAGSVVRALWRKQVKYPVG